MNQILSSWKEIAVFFGKGVRTVQRWEQQLGLPIHRPAEAPQNIVIAYSEELLEWLNATARLPRKTLVFAESDRFQRVLVQSFLEMTGYHVLPCENAEACLDQLHPEAQVDLVLTDMHMPGMNGMELIKRLKSLKPGLPAILLSTDHGDAETPARLQVEACYFLAKPFRFQELQALLHDCLEDRSSGVNQNLLTFPSKRIFVGEDAEAS